MLVNPHYEVHPMLYKTDALLKNRANDQGEISQLCVLKHMIVISWSVMLLELGKILQLVITDPVLAKFEGGTSNCGQ